jgi:hypothetical protein
MAGVASCVILVDGESRRFEGLLEQRVLCASCRISTLRPSFLHPHRVFEPVSPNGLAEYLTATYKETAEKFQCSPRSVWRWVPWIPTTIETGAVLSEAERLSRTGQSANLIPREVSQEHHVKARTPERETTLVAAFRGLCALAIWARSQPVPPEDPSPLRFFLIERFRTFRVVHWLSGGNSSPPVPEYCTGPPGVHGRA